jgi:hypothetical protein
MRSRSAGAFISGIISLNMFLTVSYGEHTSVQTARRFTEPANVKISCDKTLIVTHASTDWDHTRSTQKSLNTLLKKAEKKTKVIFLQSKIDDKSYFCQHMPSDFIVKSKEGEICLPVKSQRVILAGGNFSDCQRQTVSDLLKQIVADQSPTTDIYVIGPAVYDYVNSPPYPARIMEGARRAREARELVSGNDSPTFNLSEIMGWFESDKERLQFLKTLVSKQYLTDVDIKKTSFEAIMIFGPGPKDRMSSTISSPNGATAAVRFHFIIPQYADQFEELIDEALK